MPQPYQYHTRILNYIYTTPTEGNIYLHPKQLASLLGTDEQFVRNTIASFNKEGLLIAQDINGGRVHIQPTPQGRNTFENITPSIDDYASIIMEYIFEYASQGTMSFDGEVAGKFLNIPEQYVMEVMENFENAGYIDRIHLAGYKSQVSYLLAGRKAYQKYLQQKANTQEKTKKVKSKSEIDIFISHSAKDEPIATAVIRLLRAATEISRSKILCTSSPGYKLKTGATTDFTLKQRIFDTPLFIAIITEQSLQSQYVLFELGARWATDKEEKFFPLVCDPKGFSLLAPPLDNINGKLATNDDELHQFIDDVCEALGLTPQRPNSYLTEMKELLALCKGDDNNQKKDNPQKNLSANNIELNDQGETPEQMIRRKAKEDFPNDFTTQKYVIQTELAAVSNWNNFTTHSLPDDVVNSLKQQIAADFPDSYSTRVYVLQQQIEAYKELNG